MTTIEFDSGYMVFLTYMWHGFVTGMFMYLFGYYTSAIPKFFEMSMGDE